MLEKLIQKKVIDYAKKKNVFALKIDTTTHAGMPDYMLIYKGLVIFIEFKSSFGTLSVLQLAVHELLREEYLCDIIVIDDVHEGYEVIDAFIADGDSMNSGNKGVRHERS